MLHHIHIGDGSGGGRGGAGGHVPPGILSRGHRGAQRLSANGIRVRISCVIGRAGASPPSRNRRAIFMYDRPCDGTDTVISISPSRVAHAHNLYPRLS